MIKNIMKMRDILGNQKARKGFTSSTVGAILRNASNNLYAFCLGQMKNRSTADTVDGNTVNEVGLSKVLSGANDTGEEAQRIGFNSGKAKPPNFNTDAERLAHWEKCYGDLWK